MIDLGAVTTSLVTKLVALMDPTPVGDGVAPAAGGWPEGVPNTQAEFVPYVVLKYGGATPSLLTDTPLCSTFAVRFSIPYSLVAYDNDRHDSDELAHRARQALDDLGDFGEEQLGDLTARFHHIYLDSMNGALRDDSTFPKMWASATNFRLDVARKPQP